mmetsp:Transcript_66568/g.148590  ORF Transcript_66568/g.148590 Transcript_66568/m.148590 type:complete len:91 (-) Transcript_66568:33-305(-)
MPYQPATRLKQLRNLAHRLSWLTGVGESCGHDQPIRATLQGIRQQKVRAIECIQQCIRTQGGEREPGGTPSQIRSRSPYEAPRSPEQWVT